MNLHRRQAHLLERSPSDDGFGFEIRDGEAEVAKGIQETCRVVERWTNQYIEATVKRARRDTCGRFMWCLVEDIEFADNVALNRRPPGFE